MREILKINQVKNIWQGKLLKCSIWVQYGFYRDLCKRVALAGMWNGQATSTVSGTLKELESGRRQWHPTPVILPGKSHGRRSLVGCSPWGWEELDTIEWLHFHFSLSCTREGNGNPLQCSCLENPRDRGAWWAPSLGSHRVGHNWSDLAAAAKIKVHILKQNGINMNILL